MRAAVVGGGFWGLASALALARSGFRVTLFEEHRRVGVPEHCTGLVSRRVLDYLGRSVESSVVARYSWLRLCGPTHCARIAPRGGVYKLDRVEVEDRLLAAAESEGVDARLGVRVSRVEPSGSLAWSGGGSASFDVVVLAEGALGRLRRRLGIGYSGGFTYAVNAEAGECGLDAGGFTVAFHPEARGLFTWLIPLPGGSCLAGSGSRDPRAIPRALRAGLRVIGAPGGLEFTRHYGGPLPLDGPARRLRAGRVVVVGDAAGMVKPLTGGGLYPAALFHRLALEALSSAGDPAGALEAAAARVSRLLARQARAARLLREDPWLVDCLALAAGSSGLDSALAGLVDYDLHHRIPATAAARAPLKTMAAGLRILTRCPTGAARLAWALAAGLVGGSRGSGA
ncbi:NAD(P)/FAD-dependent oxidoreductase [Stetteria hydrogenophila]